MVTWPYPAKKEWCPMSPRLTDWSLALAAVLAFMTGVVTLALVSGIWWVGGGNWYFAGFNLLNWHIVLGFVVTAAIAFHMLARAKRLRKRDISGRRRALHFSVLLLGSAAFWPAQQLAERALKLPGASERFTGNRESNSYAGNVFPTS